MMFNNLIESSSHSKEYKRRGSFFLLTTITYALLLSITGVASIYAYDAHLETQSTELDIVMFVPPTSPEEVVPEIPRNTIRPAANETSTTPVRSTRTELIDSASNPNNPPKDVGTIASSVPPARSDSEIGRFNADPVLPTGARTGVPGGEGEPRPNVVIADPPPPPPPPPTNKIIKTSKVLNSQAISLPKPTYPPLAIQIRLQGTVNVQVLIDETGKVISAQALGGPPMLIPEAKKAALRARFSPTMIGEQPVKVSGVITYNFQLQ
jgi:TonB family protein